eukprot:scaffold45749_cov60-Phaeocystis_antarctica.AAC.6
MSSIGRGGSRPAEAAAVVSGMAIAGSSTRRTTHAAPTSDARLGSPRARASGRLSGRLPASGASRSASHLPLLRTEVQTCSISVASASIASASIATSSTATASRCTFPAAAPPRAGHAECHRPPPSTIVLTMTPHIPTEDQLCCSQASAPRCESASCRGGTHPRQTLRTIHPSIGSSASMHRHALASRPHGAARGCAIRRVDSAAGTTASSSSSSEAAAGWLDGHIAMVTGGAPARAKARSREPSRRVGRLPNRSAECAGVGAGAHSPMIAMPSPRASGWSCIAFQLVATGSTSTNGSEPQFPKAVVSTSSSVCGD